MSESMKLGRRSFLGALGATGALMAPGIVKAQPCSSPELPTKWDYETDVVVVGTGACGMVAIARLAETGLSVLAVDTNYDVGGHAILSGGTMTLGGGTAMQKKYGIKDDPETFFHDLTDWSVTLSDGTADYRYNDREVQYAIAHNSPKTFDFLYSHGVGFIDEAPDSTLVNHANGISAPRAHHIHWDRVGEHCLESPVGRVSSEIIRPLEKFSRDKGVRFLLNYHMDDLYRDSNNGPVIGLKAHYTPTIIDNKKLKSWQTKGNIDESRNLINIKAKKAVVIATGGSVGNVHFRCMCDPRLTKEIFCAGEEFSPQDASGELAALGIGAALSGTMAQTNNRFYSTHPVSFVGTKTGYTGWTTKSPIWGKIKSTGLFIRGDCKKFCVSVTSLKS